MVPAAFALLAVLAPVPDVSFAGRVPSPTHSGTNPYREVRRIVTGPLPHAVASGDLDGDGAEELVVAARRHDDVSIFRREGDAWERVGQLFLDGYPGDLRLADTDGDGALDLLATDQRFNWLYQWRNRGDGTFEEPVRLITGVYPAALVIADFNGDGKPDAATAEYDVRRGSATIFLNRGDGRLVHRLSLDMEKNAIALAAGDVDQDGRADLVVACSGNDRILVLYGSGDGTFSRRITLISAHEPYAVALLDANRDGWPDIAAACEGEDVVSYFAGKNEHRFEARVDLPAGHEPYALAVADWNEDGRDDLVVANKGSHSLTLFESSLDGQPERIDDVPGGEEPSRLLLADIDGDRRTDLVSVCEGEGALRFFRNESAGTSVREFTAGFENGRVRLAWQVAFDRQAGTAYEIFRRFGDGPWQPVGSRVAASSRVEVVDAWPAEANPEYRIDEFEANFPVRQIGPIRITAPVPEAPGIRLDAANPGSGPVRLVVETPVTGPARLDVFDIQGRRVAGLLDDVVPAGRRVIDWAGTNGGGAPLASGIYLVRLEAAGAERVVRLVRAR
ncbi:MAG TPA: FG-GAP-like repeat-containing protein [Candidatus Eisenbacteria bacterium]